MIEPPPFKQVLRPILVGLGISFLLAFTGCGSDERVAIVEGAVQIDGKPVEGGAGTLICVTSTGIRITTPIDQTGHFLLYNPPEGTHKVGVTLVEYMTFEQAMRPGQKPPQVLVPAKYADPEKSGLTLTVSTGKQQYNIDLAP